MSRRKQLISRWKTDYDFKTITAAFGSLAATVVFAIYNGFLGIYHASLWHGSICVYYLILSILRGLIIAAERRIAPGRRQDSRKRVYLRAAALLLILNISLVVPLALMVVEQKPVHLTLIPAISMAAYTTYKITMASVNLRRRRASANRLVRLLRTISFIDALVSILTLQNTLIMVSTQGDGGGMLTMTAITSGAVWLAVLYLSGDAIIRGVKSVKKGD